MLFEFERVCGSVYLWTLKEVQMVRVIDFHAFFKNINRCIRLNRACAFDNNTFFALVRPECTFLVRLHIFLNWILDIAALPLSRLWLVVLPSPSPDALRPCFWDTKQAVFCSFNVPIVYLLVAQILTWVFCKSVIHQHSRVPRQCVFPLFLLFQDWSDQLQNFKSNKRLHRVTYLDHFSSRKISWIANKMFSNS